MHRRQAKPICHWSQEMINLGNGVFSLVECFYRRPERAPWIFDKGLDRPKLCVMPYLIGAIALVIALTAIILVFHSMYKAFRQDLADFNHCDNWDVTLTELEQIHTDSSLSVISVIRNFGFKFYISQNSGKYPKPSTTRRLSVPHWLHLNRTYKTIKQDAKKN